VYTAQAACIYQKDENTRDPDPQPILREEGRVGVKVTAEVVESA
jgi:hypothetical protein